MTFGIRSVMKEVRDRTAEILDGTSLEDLIARSNRMLESGRPFMYHIQKHLFHWPSKSIECINYDA